MYAHRQRNKRQSHQAEITVYTEGVVTIFLTF